MFSSESLWENEGRKFDTNRALHPEKPRNPAKDYLPMLLYNKFEFKLLRSDQYLFKAKSSRLRDKKTERISCSLTCC